MTPLKLERLSDASLSILLFLSASVWGLYWFPLREIEEAGVIGTWSVVYMNACPLLILLPIVAVKWRLLRINTGPAIFISLAVGLGFTGYASGLVTAPVVRATLLFYLTPIWSTIIGIIWLSEPVTRGRIIAIALGLVGLVLLMAQAGETSAPLGLGDLLAFSSGIFWAIGAATMKRYPETPILILTTGQFVGTSLASILVTVLIFRTPLPPADAFVAAFPMAFFSSVLILMPTIVLIFRIAQLLFPGRVGVLMMSEVMVAIISAAILLPEETMSLIQWSGAAVILTAAFVEVTFGHRTEKSPKPT